MLGYFMMLDRPGPHAGSRDLPIRFVVFTCTHICGSGALFLAFHGLFTLWSRFPQRNPFWRESRHRSPRHPLEMFRCREHGATTRGAMPLLIKKRSTPSSFEIFLCGRRAFRCGDCGQERRSYSPAAAGCHVFRRPHFPRVRGNRPLVDIAFRTA